MHTNLIIFANLSSSPSPSILSSSSSFKVTLCVRTMALTYTNPVDAAFAYSLYFGTLLPVALIIIKSLTDLLFLIYVYLPDTKKTKTPLRL